MSDPDYNVELDSAGVPFDGQPFDDLTDDSAPDFAQPTENDSNEFDWEALSGTAAEQAQEADETSASASASASGAAVPRPETPPFPA